MKNAAVQPRAGSGSAGRRQVGEFGSPGDAAGGGKGSHDTSVRGTLSFKKESQQLKFLGQCFASTGHKYFLTILKQPACGSGVSGQRTKTQTLCLH